MIQWNLLHFAELQRLPVPLQLATFADAYLTSANQLCLGLSQAPSGANYSHGAVVMSLAFHAQELLLKAAILAKSPLTKFRGRRGHDLKHLHDQYSNLYPGNSLQIDLLFQHTLPEMGEVDPQIVQELHAYIAEQAELVPEDQRHRYPTGLDGQTWAGGYAFDASEFLSELSAFRQQFDRLVTVLREI